MKYNPKDANQCLPEGEYEATILSCDDKPAKSGADMWTVTFEVYPQSGANVKIKDYIVNPGTLWKAKGLAKALGALETFNAGRFDPSDFLQMNVRLVLKIEEDDAYGDKNVIKKYLPTTLGSPIQAANSVPKPARVQATEITEDDIPF